MIEDLTPVPGPQILQACLYHNSRAAADQMNEIHSLCEMKTESHTHGRPHSHLACDIIPPTDPQEMRAPHFPPLSSVLPSCLFPSLLSTGDWRNPSLQEGHGLLSGRQQTLSRSTLGGLGTLLTSTQWASGLPKRSNHMKKPRSGDVRKHLPLLPPLTLPGASALSDFEA